MPPEYLFPHRLAQGICCFIQHNIIWEIFYRFCKMMQKLCNFSAAACKAAEISDVMAFIYIFKFVLSY